MRDDFLFNIWHNACRSRFFDEQVRKFLDSGAIKCFVYLSSGQEVIAAAIAEGLHSFGVRPPVFCQHRNHAAYLSFDGDPTKLRDELLGRSTGCTCGVGGDPMIHDIVAKIFGHSGLVADQMPIAVGYAFAMRSPVVCFGGDATVEEDVFWPAVGFAVTHGLPVLFVIEDNDLSVITKKETRRSWNARDVAAAFGLKAHSEVDEPANIYQRTREFLKFPQPTYLEVLCCRKYRHVGSETDGQMNWDRLGMMRNHLYGIDPDKTRSIEREVMREMEALWES